MAAINDLINQIDDRELRERIKAEVDKLSKQKKFGLVFEDHVPECTALYDVPVHVGSKVALKDKKINDVYVVKAMSGNLATCVNTQTKDTAEFSIDSLVSIAEFGEAIYPYLKPVESIENAPDSSLWHTLIEADNYHALQLLEYLYAGKVDCIYIDPPYNTGAKDWKYNNDYVDSSDAYRHSKWLSMMEKRLKLAKKLLNPSTGILMVAIDDNELCPLGMLLREIFYGYKFFCITIVHNPNGNQGKNFAVQNEFVFFALPNGNQLLTLENRIDSPDIRPLRDVSGNNNMRTDAKNCFYPIYVENNKIVGFGDVCRDNFHPASANIKRNDGILEIYPIDASGKEKKWVFARQTVASILDELRVQWNSSREIYDIIRHKTHFTYKTVWQKKKYNANSYGSKLIRSILGQKRFDYPKSLYTVEECIRAVSGNRKNALILDFFAGSGTTLHAVNLLNAEDGGHRRCIMVTNNEVSDEEAKKLKKDGFKPGDPEWERLGIAHYVTWPRTVCSIKGEDINSNPLKGTYLDSERAMADGFKANAAFFKLGFLDKNAVALGRQFKELLPVLWMKTGCVGLCPKLEIESLPSMLILPQNAFAVLIDEHTFPEFMAKVNDEDRIKQVFIVTDSTSGYREMISHLSIKKSYQLYRDYLDNFRINTGR